MKVSLGLWGLQAPWSQPSAYSERLAELLDSATLAENLGFDGIWLSEHRMWYDGYDSTPLQTATRILARTQILRVGTAVLLLPQHEPHTISERILQMRDLFGDRLDLGVGLGYRNIEYDALGLERRERGKRMDAALLVLAEKLRSEAGGLRLYVGAASDPALRRAGRNLSGLILPGGWSPETVAEGLDVYRDSSGGQAPFDTAIVRHVCITNHDRRTRDAIDAVVRLFHDQYGGMAELEGSSKPHPGVANPFRELTVGSPKEVASTIRRYRRAGVTHFIARLHNPYLPHKAVVEEIKAFAELLAEESAT